MPDLVIVATDIELGGTTSVATTIQPARFGELVVDGDAVYLKSSDNKYWKTDNSAEESAQVAGIVVKGASADGWGVIATDGEIVLGNILTKTDEYVVSSNAGKIAPKSDLGSGEYYSAIGYGKSTTVLKFDKNVSGLTK